MIRSFLNIFLPEDEYKRLQVLYFMAETTFLTVVILLLVGFFKYILSFEMIDITFLVMYGPFIMMTYVYVRYILSGIEFTEVANTQTYKKRRRSIVKSAITFGILFAIFYFIPFGPRKEGLEAIAFVGLIVFFYFLFDYISLKRSYKKNEDLSDD
ncbi:hypothetical protein EU245_12130 [Lentibacillus lipolyticus]|nr:hypothetical protein EU245_12130 [Lentibacillus lipolyticus]